MEDFYLNAKDLPKKGVSTGTNPVIPIVSLMFKSIHDAHITHLMQANRTLARHTAMELYYDGAVEDLVDELCELSMGIYPETSISVDKSGVIEDPIAYFTNLMSTIETLRKPVKESFLQNKIDEVCAEIAHTLYRLKFITT